MGQVDMEQVRHALEVLSAASGIPRQELKTFLLMRSYRASLPVILQRLTGRREMRVLRACTAGDPSVGINGDEAFLILGREYLDVDDQYPPDGLSARDDLRKAFAGFCQVTFMDGKVGAIYDDECPDCGKVLTDVGNCPDTHCISNREG